MVSGARLLLLSNSTAAGSTYLELWRATIMSFLGVAAKNVLFVPFAGVTIDWDEYTGKVQAGLPHLNITGIHTVPDMMLAVNTTDVIMIGGGNTFHLLANLQKNNLLEVIRERVLSGVPYVGWSAGSNVATPDIGTTNDMPVTWPDRYEALNLVDFNINPHYSNWKPPKYQGEGRDERLDEAVIAKKRTIVALSEGVGILAGDQNLLIVKSPASLRPPESLLQVRIWKPLNTAPFFHVVDVPMNQSEDKFSLSPYLKDE